MQFLYPNVLFLMLIPTFVLFFFIISKKSKFEKIFNQDILNKLLISNSNLTKKSRNILLFIALIFMVIALSRPVSNKKEQNINQELVPLVIAIDTSKSMLAQDVYPNRLTMAKNKILRLIKSPNELSIGVLIFAKSSFILSPLTNDFTSLKFLIENFDYNLDINDGSNIYSALEASNKLLKDYKSKNILFLTDGGNSDEYKEEIEYANKNNLNVYTITIGTDAPTPIPSKDGYLKNKNGDIAMVKINQKIKELSLKTNGGYTNFTVNSDDINSIVNDISSKTNKINMKLKKQKTYTELFYYPLGLALFILLLAFSSLPTKKSVIKIFILIILINNQNIKASILDFNTIKDATKAYENKDYKTSSNKFKDFINTSEGKYNFANSLYQEKKYQSALNMYKDITTSDEELEFKKLHNMGNSYVKLNDLENAKKMYEKALKIKDDKQTKENLDIVNEALKKRENKDKEENEKDNQKQNQQNQNKQNKKDSDKKENEKKQENDKSAKKEQTNKNEKDLKNKDKKAKNASQIKEDILSKKEEKKWLNLLENQKTPVLLKKVETKNSSKNSSSSPW